MGLDGDLYAVFGTAAHSCAWHGSEKQPQSLLLCVSCWQFISPRFQRSVFAQHKFDASMLGVQRAFTTGIRGFAECLGHSAKLRLYSAKGTRQRFYRQRRIYRVPFVGHSAKALPSAKKHSAKRSTRQNINRKKSKKMKQKKRIYWGRHAHPTSHPSNGLHILFSNFS
jgi:hypothetical protein